MPDATDTLVQNRFLSQLWDEKISVTVFLINGVKLQGLIAGFDDATLLLQRDGHAQLVYKHAVSTLQPASAVRLPGGA